MIATQQPTTAGKSNGQPTALHPNHLAELRASGLTDETIRAAGIRSEHNRDKLAAILNRKSWPQTLGAALVFPYVDSEGTTTLHRVKPDRPSLRNGKGVKYIAPTGSTLRAYFPPGAHERIRNGAVEIVHTEGEKKALAGNQAGYCCIGLPGVDCWHGKKSTALLPDLEFSWAGRTAYIVFDSDAADNARIRKQELLFAAQLKLRGATAKIVRLPAGPNGEKVGLDDFLVAHGSGELRKLLDSAGMADELPADVCQCEAFEADPRDVATKFRESISLADDCRLRFWRGEWWYWQGSGYRLLSDGDLRARLVEFFSRDYYNVKREHISNALEHLRSLCLVPSHEDAPTWLDSTPTDWPASECIATKSGIFHLASYAELEPCLRSSTPRYFTTTGVEYSFDPDAPEPSAWLQFLASLWADDWQSIALLREFMGYCLTADTSQQKLLLIVGPKRSGKGTILRVLRALVGALNVAAPTLSSLCERFGLWPLIGKSLAIISDARLSGRADQAVIVERILSVTGEDAQTVDRKNLQPVTVKLPTRFVIVTNELPRIGDSSGALVSRMMLLQTTESFYGREDHGLTDKLLAELPGIFLWAVAGWQALRERGRFVQPQRSAELLGELQDLSSPIGAFVRERCIVDPAASCPVDLLYAEWKSFCESGGKLRPTDKATFGRDLLAAVPTVRKQRQRIGEDRERTYVYVGVEVRLEGFCP